MEKEEKFYYETIKTPFKRIFLLLVVLFWVIPTVVMMTFRLEMAAQITIAISSLMLFCGFCGGFYAKQKMEYGAITISEDYKTLTLFRNNLPVKVIYNNCIARVDLNITNMSIHCIDGEVVKLKLDADDEIDLYVQIFKKVSDVDPSRQAIKKERPYFIDTAWLQILGLAVVMAILVFSFQNCYCDKTSGVCATGAYSIFAGGKHNEVFEIKNIKKVYKDFFRPFRNIGFYKIYVQCEYNRIDTGYSYVLPFSADNFTTRFQNFLDSNENTFSYYYISPLFVLFLLGALFSFAKSSKVDLKNTKNLILLLGAAGLVFSAVYSVFDNQQVLREEAVKLSNPHLALNTPPKQEQKGLNDFISLEINQPTEYDYLSREEIFNLRKKYVNNSLFASKFYRPSNEVFGAIEGNKPWYGENIACPFSAKDITAGYSARRIYVNNPAILVGAIQTLGYKYPQDTPFCKNKLLNFMPQKILYSKKNNLLIVRYNADNSLINNIQEPQYGMPLGFVGLNARDLGYKYGFAASNRNIIYKERNNISKNVYKFRDFLHTGGSCRVPGGCTNTSPLQPEMDFFIQELPAEITFKLWKNEPQSPNEKADILYKVIFD